MILASLLRHTESLSTPWALLVALWGVISGGVAWAIGTRYQPDQDEGSGEFAKYGPLHCPACAAEQPWPMAATGRCTSCHHWNWWVLVAVIANTAICLLMLATIGVYAALIPFLWLVPALTVVTTTDLRTQLIPARVVWVSTGVGIALLGMVSWHMGAMGFLRNGLIAAVAVFMFFFIMNVISPGGLGFGDVRLSFLLGLYTGWIYPTLTIWAVVFGCVAYLAYGIPLRLARSTYSPFGPGLALGAVIAISQWSSFSHL